MTTVSDRDKERDLKSSIRELAAALESGLSDHPTLEELRDFAVGKLPENRRERLREHLSLCRACAQKVAALAGPPEEVRRGDLLTEEELDAEWKRFQAKSGATRGRQVLQALAALLLLAVVGSIVWQLRPTPKREQIARLDPLTDVRGGAEPSNPIVPDGAEILALSLSLDSPKPLPVYDVEIFILNGGQVWSRRGVPSKDSEVEIKVPFDRLPPGIYRISLLGPQRSLEEEYEFSIQPAP